MAKSRVLQKLEDSKPSMTSMIDIVFLLLVFFILMPFKSIESKIENHLPKIGDGLSDSTIQDLDKIQIEIKRDGSQISTKNGTGVSLSINGRVIENLAGVKIRLNEIKNSLPASKLGEIPLLVNADENVPFYFILKTVDFSKLSGFTKINFPSPPELNSGKKPRGI